MCGIFANTHQQQRILFFPLPKYMWFLLCTRAAHPSTQCENKEDEAFVGYVTTTTYRVPSIVRTQASNTFRRKIFYLFWRCPYHGIFGFLFVSTRSIRSGQLGLPLLGTLYKNGVTHFVPRFAFYHHFCFEYAFLFSHERWNASCCHPSRSRCRSSCYFRWHFFFFARRRYKIRRDNIFVKWNDHRQFTARAVENDLSLFA